MTTDIITKIVVPVQLVLDLSPKTEQHSRTAEKERNVTDMAAIIHLIMKNIVSKLMFLI